MTSTTPIPNKLFDFWLRHLKGSELMVLMVISRQTLGWKDKRSISGRKERDWISTSQFTEKTGCSRRVISSSIESLSKKGLIKIYDSFGYQLFSSSERKGKTKLFFSLAPALLYPTTKSVLPITSTYAKSAQDLSKNVTVLAQKLLIDK